MYEDEIAREARRNDLINQENAWIGHISRTSNELRAVQDRINLLNNKKNELNDKIKKYQNMCDKLSQLIENISSASNSLSSAHSNMASLLKGIRGSKCAGNMSKDLANINQQKGNLNNIKTIALTKIKKLKTDLSNVLKEIEEKTRTLNGLKDTIAKQQGYLETVRIALRCL